MICVWVIRDINQNFKVEMALIYVALNVLGCLKKENKLFYT
jgi:hypothetical protein